LGYKVIWLFDLSDLYESKKISFTTARNGLAHSWKNPKKCFNAFDVETGAIDLFFQIGKSDKSIVRVTHVSKIGFEMFETTFLMSKADFLAYVGLKNGECKRPQVSILADKGEYQAFKKKYNIDLNPQQERAMLSTEGAVLLLAVPGSGKTTVLVDRLGYMILEKKISSDNILALTYNRKACAEMNARFKEKFGRDLNVDFKTINSLADQIYGRCCTESGKPKRKLISESEKRKLLKEIYRQHSDQKYIAFDEVSKLSTAIDFIKNMQLYGNRSDYEYFRSNVNLSSVDGSIPNLTDMYNAYQNELDQKKKMDFDDQIYFALMCLKKHSRILEEYRGKYRYICVDEAQDTSKLQHQLIKMLAEGNSLFMVEDEDQCIYGFRGAYPNALLNFRFDYKNPLILRMETNYRSTPEIVYAAQKFISQNTGRYNKNMTAFRSLHQKVKIVNVTSRMDQYKDLAARLIKSQGEVAVLCRNNDSLLPLIDFLKTNGISYNCKKPNMDFFEIKSVKLMLTYLKLLANPDNVVLYRQLNNRGILHIDDDLLDDVVNEIQGKKVKLGDILTHSDQIANADEIGKLISFDLTIRNIARERTNEAIQSVVDVCCDKSSNALKNGSDQIETLKIIAAAYPHIPDFLKHIEDLKRAYNSGANGNSPRITLSTIHNSKGLEFKTVYIIDVYDGRFPANGKSIFKSSKDLFNGDMEERRLFYVALTRAKDNLFLYSLADHKSAYISEIRSEGRGAVCDSVYTAGPAVSHGFINI
jgi:superfamily I DNA/RNA helicase